MSKPDNTSFASQLKHWEKRRDDLADWLINNSYEHANYTQNQSDYSHAVLKVQQIEDHIDRVKNGPRDVGPSYPMPQQIKR